MKPMLWALGAAGVLVCGLVVGMFALGFQAVLADRPAPAAVEPAQAEPNPFEQWAPKNQPAAERFPVQVTTTTTCPAGFVDQGGVCVGQESAAYQADLQRRRDIEHLADELADELQAD